MFFRGNPKCHVVWIILFLTSHKLYRCSFLNFFAGFPLSVSANTRKRNSVWEKWPLVTFYARQVSLCFCTLYLCFISWVLLSYVFKYLDFLPNRFIRFQVQTSFVFACEHFSILNYSLQHGFVTTWKLQRCEIMDSSAEMTLASAEISVLSLAW